MTRAEIIKYRRKAEKSSETSEGRYAAIFLAEIALQLKELNSLHVLTLKKLYGINRANQVLSQRGGIPFSPDVRSAFDHSVEDFDMSVRSYNCLFNANIKTIRELIQKTDAEMLKTKNFGIKSLNEIKEILASMGLTLGMEIDEHGNAVPGTDPQA